MEFDNPKGIYQQITEQLQERILRGEWGSGERIPAVRAMAAGLGVNPNTITRSYQSLVDKNFLENRRGIGYFVREDAKERILEERKEVFVRQELPRLFSTMDLLGLDMKELRRHCLAYQQRKKE